MEREKAHRDSVAQEFRESSSTNSIADDSVDFNYNRKFQIPGNCNQTIIYSSVGDAVIAEDGLRSESDVATPKDLVVYNIGATQNEAELNGDYEEFDPQDDGSQEGCDSVDWENNRSGYIEFCEIERAESQNPLLMGTSIAFGTHDWIDFEQVSNGGTFPSLNMNTLNKPHDSPLVSNLYDTIDAQSISEGSDIDGSADEKRIEDLSTNNFVPECRSNSTHNFEATLLNDILFSTEPDIVIPTKEQLFNPNEFDDDIVREMEAILLDPKEQSTSNLSPLDSPSSFSSPDGGLFSSTSNHKDPHSPPKITAVEVIGAKQKKGNVSFSERIVGVREYTVYSIRVSSEESHWVIERRYREFYALYCNLKSYFLDHCWILPSEWSALEQESRKLFGSSSPDVVKERSILIQKCLQSVINNDSFSSYPGEFLWFLSAVPSSSHSERVSLLVEDHQEKPLNQILESQQHQCFGCRKKLDSETGVLRGFVKSLGWGNPRLCMYSGQVFCSSCHVNDHVILPGRVLHHWDFTQHPVSQSSKSYLDSIYDQPMLCVSAVNPFLYSRVPALHHVVALRKKLENIVSLVKCPFRITVSKALGPRKYLLESSDFFALRDLVDLSKGSFSALPGMLQACTKKITEHIVESCLICYDVGVPCGSRQSCSNPSSLVFPFQEDDVEKCETCGCVYHKVCYVKNDRCSCGADGRRGDDVSFVSKFGRMPSRNLLGGGTGWFPSIKFAEPLFGKSD